MGQGMPGPDLDPVVVRFAQRLRASYRVERLILFGSRARGNHLLESDYDLLIVSNDFQGIPFPQRMARISELWDGPNEAEFLCYTPAEFAQKRQELGIVGTALEEGIDL